MLPARFRDFVATPLSELPPDIPESPSEALPSSPSRIRKFIDSSKNVFGLFRRYVGKRPDHNPEDVVNLEELVEIPAGLGLTPQEPRPAAGSNCGGSSSSGETPATERLFHHFPNESSLKLGDWYLSDGSKKSLSSLKKLVEVVGSESFKPADVRNTQWQKAFRELGANEFDNPRLRDSNPLEQLDGDASWKKHPIHIQVPFHRREKRPGPQEFHAGDLYHRSLVEVIKEKLSNPADCEHFHYQPYELYWQPTSDTGDPIRVHGELYTSPAFLDAHIALQDLPCEPGCTLPRVVVALMFASDATHLTSFGDAKLWPCYLYFGNESKYRRSKPTCKLCNHVAYFQTVRHLH